MIGSTTLALIAAATDWVLAGDGRRVRARRVLATDKLSLGAWNPVQIELSNTTARRQHVVVRDQPPPSFLVDVPAPMFTAKLAAEANSTLSYHVRPPRRGDTLTAMLDPPEDPVVADAILEKPLRFAAASVACTL